MSKEPNYKLYTRGGHISFHNYRMWDQITKTLIVICFFIWLILSGFFIWLSIPFEKIIHALAFYAAQFFSFVGKEHSFKLLFYGKTYQQSVSTILHYPYYQENVGYVMNSITVSAAWSLCCSVFLGGLFVFYFIRRGKSQSESQFVRGSRIASCDNVKAQIIRDKMHSDITIDKFPILKNSEVQHFLMHGTIGSGKSQLIMKVMDCLRKRGDRVIVYDKGCSFIPHFYQKESDVILNPFDARCANWDMWKEAPRDTDFENMAESQIPMHGEAEPFWINASRTVFSSLGAKMRHDPNRSLERFLDLILTGDFEDLEHYLQGTPAATLVSNKIEKTAISIRATLTTYIKSLSTLAGISKSGEEPFSIRDYILDETQKGWLFISSNGESHKTLKPLISMWLAMASLTLLSLPPDRNRRIWFICDELPSLQRLPLLNETVAEGRKFGACFMLGMQSYFQLCEVYGQNGAKGIFNLLNTSFLFRCPCEEAAEKSSVKLGEEEIEKSKENYSYGANSIRDGISFGTQNEKNRITSYSEIMQLNDMECFVRLPGNYPITQLKLTLEKRTLNEPGFIERLLPESCNLFQLPSFEESYNYMEEGYRNKKRSQSIENRNIEELNLEPL